MRALVILSVVSVVGLIIQWWILWRSSVWAKAPKAGRGRAVLAMLAICIISVAGLAVSRFAGGLAPLGTFGIELLAMFVVIRWSFGASKRQASIVFGVLIAFSLLMLGVALPLKLYVLEAYVLSSGSMAPTLRGPYTVMACPKCGGELVVPTMPARRSLGDAASAPLRPGPLGICASCGKPSSSSGIGDSGLRIYSPDRFVVDHLATPRRWDIVAFAADNGPFVQRLAGLPGETIYIADGTLFVNGKAMSMPNHVHAHLSDRASSDMPAKHGREDSPTRLGQDEYFVVGDFADVANDSRFMGPIKAKDVLGVAAFRYWPLSRFEVW